MRSSAPRLLVPILILCMAAAAHAEMYKWVDEAGRMHFTQDLNQVPARFRGQAEAGAMKPQSSRVQTYDAPAAPAPSIPSERKSFGTSPVPVFRVRVERAGNSMRAVARINDSVDVPFVIDTGASDVLLPQWAAESLNVDLENAREAHYTTANGVVVHKQITLESVELGGARATSIPASVSPNMSVGLLGLSFFNHFNYDVDPGAGIVTLRPNGLAESGVIRGGRSEEQWRGQFRGLRGMLESVEEERDRPSLDALRKQRLDAYADKLRQQIADLEAEADDARVPYAWRD